MDTSLNTADLNDLRMARQLLENPGLAARVTNLIGTPIEKGLDMLPAGWHGRIMDITKVALGKAADAAIFTLGDAPGGDSANRWHKWGAALSGGVGGFFGLAGLAVELPISTTLMMRSIAAIARSEGEPLQDVDTRAACLMVFALGGKAGADDATESGYYAVRVALARAVGQAADYLGTKVAADKAAVPAMIRLIAVIADRFGIQVTEKVAAQAVPALGAAGGALINTLFIDHFQDMARGHFIVRRLERKYGDDVVHAAYLALGGE
ncbi:EcsC family protein [Castellaniella caeni]|uniref:EcsC family protein n=1 Tax=Castellaniella caeni TaxID=266123 RepID=UPI0008321513|nr:EcsC family protein [Castellaniella caeni]